MSITETVGTRAVSTDNLLGFPKYRGWM